MDTIDIVIRKYNIRRQCEVAEIYINGVNLIDLVAAVERPFATAEGHPELAGQYQGLPADLAFLPSTYLLEGEYEKTALLVCSCGAVGCWPMEAKITVQEDVVIWSDFEQPHRGPDSHQHWRYDDFGPFVFDRQQYLSSLAERPIVYEYQG
ncbi:MAG TPA: hypothetical protein VFA07_08130 [Chthonomonadaceae bacterium]|nr:hypothetical protein [Chthonomonadaceae bacterium]